jgi:8-oxo-dGTP pyrophosphatase MutT (NUDIX family)
LEDDALAKPHFDPTQLPIDAIAGEAAILSERLAPAWLRERFAKPAPWTPDPTEWLAGERPPPTPAAVLVPLVQREHGLTLLLTQRTAHLNDHAGQIAFPGGRTEDSDADAIDTALRETEEEVGLHRRHVDVLGTLPDYHTGTGYVVTPVVALVTPPFALQADPFEVAEIFEVPLAFLMDGANHQLRAVDLPSGRRTFYAMPYHNYFIWGATAGMLRNLFHFLRA